MSSKNALPPVSVLPEEETVFSAKKRSILFAGLHGIF